MSLTFKEHVLNSTNQFNETNISIDANDSELCQWCLNPRIVTQVSSLFITIEFLLSLLANSFIVFNTLFHRKTLKKSSTLFLFNMALVNLVMTIFYMPFPIVANAAGEWIIGTTDKVRDVMCKVTAFVFAYTVSVSFHTLAVISFDRFLLIVKPHWHRKVLSWKVAVVIVIVLWLIAVPLNTTPFYGFGEFELSRSLGACIPLWVGNKDYLIALSIVSLIPISIILITTIWTYIFTRRFFHKDFQRRKNTVGEERLQTEKDIYHVRIRNLIGIFGSLILFNILTISPYFIAGIIGLIVGLDDFPREVFVAVFILFLLSNVTNSVIQSYFRRELRDTIIRWYTRVKQSLRVCFMCNRCSNSEHAESGVSDQYTSSTGTVEQQVRDGIAAIGAPS